MPVLYFCSSSISIGIGESFDESPQSRRNWDLWIRLAKTDVEFQSFIEKRVVVYRYVPDSMSRNGFSDYQELKKCFESNLFRVI